MQTQNLTMLMKSHLPNTTVFTEMDLHGNALNFIFKYVFKYITIMQLLPKFSQNCSYVEMMYESNTVY